MSFSSRLGGQSSVSKMSDMVGLLPGMCESQVKNGKQQQRQDGYGDQPADDDDCQRTLYLRTGPRCE